MNTSKLFILFSAIKSRLGNLLRKFPSYDPSFNLEEFLSELGFPRNSILFVHGGLKKLAKKTNKSYEEIVKEIISLLKKEYSPKAIIFPSFTESFKKTGVFSMNYSGAEAGALSEISRRLINYRTKDPLHSVIIDSKSLSEFEKLDMTDTYGNKGLFAYLNQNNAIILNISTNHFISTQIHYIEEEMKVPYLSEDNKFSGIIFDEKDKPINSTIRNRSYKQKVYMNWQKIERYLSKDNSLKTKYYKGLKLQFIDTKLLFSKIKEKIIEKPFFLVDF